MFKTSSAVLGVLLAYPLSASAMDLAFKVDPGVAVPLTKPQSDIYAIGANHSLQVLFGLTSFLDVGPTAGLIYLPNRVDGQENGVAWTVGAGARLKRPHNRKSFDGVSPWIQANALYVRTGPLDRAGFDVAIGLSVPIGNARTFWVGPFVKYSHIGQGYREGYDNRDAKLATVGLSFEFGPYGSRPLPPPEVSSAQAACGADGAAPCPDRDDDGIPDNIDRCPDVGGPAENWGCPVYKRLVVQKDRLELKEKLYFAWDQATLEDASFPLMDEVVQALKDNPSFMIQVEGHTDSTGPDDHNQMLSQQRAQTVVDYLISHGISKDRLVSKGFSSSVPTDTNATVEGRENNRRVEFVVVFNLLNL